MCAGRKRSLYEGGTRVPSFVNWGGGTPKPTIVEGAIDHTPMSATDWLPTVAALAGIDLPSELAERLDGEDMSKVFLKKTSGQRRPEPRIKPIFWEWRYSVAGACDNQAPHLAVRMGDWKYLVNADGTRPELYKLDLYAGNNTYLPDFNERQNLVLSFPERTTKLDSLLRAWHKTIPFCHNFPPSQGCAGFTSPIYPNNKVVHKAMHAKPQDSDPDWWYDPLTNTHISF